MKIIKIDDEITLRQLQKSDAADIFNTIDGQREYLGKWLPFVAFTTELSYTKSFVDAVVETPEDRLEYVFTIRKTGRFIGLIGLKSTDLVNKKTEIGYWLSEEYQKQGIVTKSVVKLCDFVFDKLGLNRVQIKCATENSHSKNIPKRLGFVFEGIERQGEMHTGNAFVDLEIYSKLKSER